MIVYRDLITGDEMISEAFLLKKVLDEEGNVVEGLMYCESEMVSKNIGAVDVRCCTDYGGSEEDLVADNVPVIVNNVSDCFQYTQTQFSDDEEFKSWIKKYMNAVVTKLREDNMPKEHIQTFKAAASGISKYLLKRFKEVRFFMGPSLNPDSVVFSMDCEQNIGDNFYFIMGGFAAEHI